MRVNGKDPIESGVVIDDGSRLVLTCEGDGPVTIEPRLYRYKSFLKHNGNSCSFTVQKASYKFTGTYKCVYTGINPSNFSSVHIFVRRKYRAYVWTWEVDWVTRYLFIMVCFLYNLQIQIFSLKPHQIIKLSGRKERMPLFHAFLLTPRPLISRYAWRMGLHHRPTWT